MLGAIPRSSVESLPELVRKEFASFNHSQRCALASEPASKLRAIEIAHVLPKSTSSHDLRLLQEAWHMKCSLNVDSLLNLMYLRADWHRAYKRGHWALLPARDLLAQIIGEVLVNEDEDDPEKDDIFTLFPLPTGKLNYVYRFIWLGESDRTMEPEHPRTTVVNVGSLDRNGDSILHIHKSAIGTPSSDPPLNTLDSQSKDEDNDIDYTPATKDFILMWLDRIDAGSYESIDSADSTDYDNVLYEYRQEPAQRAQPRLWKQWATSPPKMPRLLMNDYDTSQLSSYLWSLYHESVNLMAPTGSHRISVCNR